jgi:spore germination cell wall hydrolase CwlJ-like protein
MTTQALVAERPGPARWRIALALLIAAGLVAALALVGLAGRPGSEAARIAAQIAQGAADSPIPAVEPLVLDASDPEEARARNAAIPFSTAPNPAAAPFRFAGDARALIRATDCLAAAMLYEAGGDATGQRAVGQVVLNRLRHPAFPKTVCGVVFQGQERATGCQFTFTCDGAMTRAPQPMAWERARAVASAMLAGDVFKPVGHSTHYHTDWVMPYWSASLDKVVAVDTHLFFRWQGWWGTPPAFVREVRIAAEPAIAKLAALSPAHRDEGEELLLAEGLAGSLIADDVPAMAIGPEHIGKRIGPGRLAGIEPGGTGFLMTLDASADPARFADAAARLCAGRAQCRLLAWTDAAATPRTFPVAEASLHSMSFSYLRMKDSGIERILYNCDEFPAMPRIRCMTRRTAPASTPRLLADERGAQVRIGLPEGARPLADMRRGELVPVKREALGGLRPPAAPAGSTSGSGGSAPVAPGAP